MPDVPSFGWTYKWLLIECFHNTRKYYATLRNVPGQNDRWHYARLHNISVCYIQLAATYMSTQNWGHPAQLDYSSVTRPSLPREGLACETSARREVRHGQRCSAGVPLRPGHHTEVRSRAGHNTVSTEY